MLLLVTFDLDPGEDAYRNVLDEIKKHKHLRLNENAFLVFSDVPANFFYDRIKSFFSNQLIIVSSIQRPCSGNFPKLPHVLIEDEIETYLPQ